MNDPCVLTKWERGTFSNRKLLDALNRCEGVWLEVRVRKAGTPPTVASHRYYRGYLLPAIAQAMNEAGCEVSGKPVNVAWLHIHLKAKFLASIEWFEEETSYRYNIQSTAELDSRSMSDYIMRVERYGVEEWGIKPMDIEA